MIVIILLLVIIVIQLYLILKGINEKFSPGWGLSFGEFVGPVPECKDENDCSRGHPARWTYYENMCEPITVSADGYVLQPGVGLTKVKRDLKGSCLKKL